MIDQEPVCMREAWYDGGMTNVKIQAIENRSISLSPSCPLSNANSFIYVC